MLNILTACALLASGLWPFAALVVRDGIRQRFVLSGFLLFTSLSIVGIWYAPIRALLDGDVQSSWPAAVIAISFVAFLTGYVVAQRCRGVVMAFACRPVVETRRSRYYMFGVAGTGSFLLLLSLAFYGGTPPAMTAIDALLREGSDPGDMADMMSAARMSYTKADWVADVYGEPRGVEFAGLDVLVRYKGLCNELMAMGWRFVTAVCVIEFLLWRHRKWLLLALASFACLVTFVGGSGVRWPVAVSVIYLLMVFSFVVRIRLGTVFSLASMAFVFMAVQTLISSRGYMYLEGGSNPGQLIASLLERVFLGNGIHDVNVIDLVDRHFLHPRMGMFHIEKLLSSLPGYRVGIPLGFIIAEATGSPSGVLASCTYLGFVYADFGFWGVPLIYLLWGLATGLIQERLLSGSKDVLDLAVSLLVLLEIGLSFSTGPIGVVTNLILVLGFRALFGLCGRVGCPSSSQPSGSGSLPC